VQDAWALQFYRPWRPLEAPDFLPGAVLDVKFSRITTTPVNKTKKTRDEADTRKTTTICGGLKNLSSGGMALGHVNDDSIYWPLGKYVGIFVVHVTAGHVFRLHVHFTKGRAVPLDGHRQLLLELVRMWLKYALRQLRMDSRNAYAFGGDDGPVKHVVFWYMYDNRENLRPGRVRDWDRDGLVDPRSQALYYTLFIIRGITFSWLQKLDGWRREDVVAESDRRVDDARVGGHRLGRWGIHDRTTFVGCVYFDGLSLSNVKLAPFQRSKKFSGSQENHRKITGKSIDIYLLVCVGMRIFAQSIKTAKDWKRSEKHEKGKKNLINIK